MVRYRDRRIRTPPNRSKMVFTIYALKRWLTLSASIRNFSVQLLQSLQGDHFQWFENPPSERQKKMIISVFAFLFKSSYNPLRNSSKLWSTKSWLFYILNSPALTTLTTLGSFWSSVPSLDHCFACSSLISRKLIQREPKVHPEWSRQEGYPGHIKTRNVTCYVELKF